MIPLSVLFGYTFATPEPAITVSGDSTGVVFLNCGFQQVESGLCVIQVMTPTGAYVDAYFPLWMQYDYTIFVTYLSTAYKGEASCHYVIVRCGC